MTQTWVSVVKKSPCGQGTLCKAMGLQTSTRAKGKQLGFGMGRRVFSCCGAEAVGRDRGGEGGAETDGQKLATQAPAWPDLCQFGLSSPTSAIKSLTGTTEAQGSDACLGSEGAARPFQGHLQPWLECGHVGGHLQWLAPLTDNC